MPSFNQVILAGNLTRDIELRYTAKGTAVAKMSLAINRKWNDGDGNPKEEVTFVDCDAFGRTAEVCSQYLKKGSPALINGRLKLDQWDDKATGQKRNRLGVVVEGVQFLDGRSGQDNPQSERGGDPNWKPRPIAGRGPEPARAQTSPRTPAPGFGVSDDPNYQPPDAEDDVPF